MPDFEPGDVVRVPFPYTDGDARQHRPAMVVARTGLGEGSGLLLWLLMITSAENRAWAGEVVIPNAAAAGLPAPSVIRCAKIATFDAAHAEVRGRVVPGTLTDVRARLHAILALSR